MAPDETKRPGQRNDEVVGFSNGLARSGSIFQEPEITLHLEGLALQVDFSTDKTAAIPGSPTAVVNGDSQYIDDTRRIEFQKLSPQKQGPAPNLFLKGTTTDLSLVQLLS